MKGITVSDTEFQGKSIALCPRPSRTNEVRVTVRGEGTINDISKDDARALRDWLTEWLDEGEPVTPSYDENVTRLVEAGQCVLGRNSDFYYRYSLEEALAPFQPPDPDAGLIEDMARALYVDTSSDELDWENHNDKEYWRNKARRALAVVRAHDKARE